MSGPVEQGTAGVAGVLAAHRWSEMDQGCRDCPWRATTDPTPWRTQHDQHVAAVLQPYLDAEVTRRVDAEKAAAVEEALLTEADWLTRAHADSADKRYSAEYRAGFLAAAGWVRFHSQLTSEGRRPAPEGGA